MLRALPRLERSTALSSRSSPASTVSRATPPCSCVSAPLQYNLGFAYVEALSQSLLCNVFVKMYSIFSLAGQGEGLLFHTLVGAWIVFKNGILNQKATVPVEVDALFQARIILKSCFRLSR